MKTQRKIVVYLVTLNLIVSSLLSPISTAYASETDSSSVASNDVSTPAPISESVVDSGNAASCVNGDDRADSVSFPSVDTEFESNIQYVYIAQPFLLVGQTQEVAFATLDESDVLKSASISLVNESGEIQTIEASALSGNSAGFSFGPDLPVDSYSLSRISYCLNDSSDPVFIDLSSNNFSFTVTDETASSDSSDMSVYYADQNGNTVQASSIEDALALSDDDSGIEAFSADSRSARKNVRVIALDAGHGGTDPGAQGNGKSEADLTWKIVSACKAKLEGYGFKVILAREQSSSYGSNDYLYRVQRCVSQGAQAYISFHINSGSSAAHGAEVYSPTVNGSDFTQVSYDLAQKVQSNLVELGLSNRGVFQMQLGDEFAVIRCAREAGIPGILIEHGFISNWGDTNNYFSDAGCKRLGEADADAIIAQFPKSSWLDYSAVFDADYYLSNNPDVNRWANGSKEKALEHFIDYGMSEGRRGSASFDVQSYYNEYPDLRMAFGSNLASYYEHYITNGRAEGRHGTGCSEISGMATSRGGRDYSAVYDPAYYLGAYPDLKKAFTRGYGSVTLVDDAALLAHFVGCGMSEGRRGSASFDVQSYYNEYPDLRMAFGSNLASYYEHYITNGRAEGRHGTGCSEISGMATSRGGRDYSAVYDPAYYLGAYPDLKKAFTRGYGSVTLVDDAALLAHFVGCGMSEGRRGSASFDVQSYRCRYSDLRRSFGTNLSLYYLHFIDFGKKEGRDGSPTDLSLYSIMGTPFVSDSDLAGYYKKKVGESTYPAAVYSSFGAPSIDEFCSIVFEEACAEGVHPEVVFCQSMIETGWLRFGGSVKAEQCNFAGIGAVSTSASGTSFPDVRTGVRAQVQHLKAYASLSPLNKACVDPRFNLVERGCAPLLTDLDGRWAVPGDGYGNRIYCLVSELISLNY